MAKVDTRSLDEWLQMIWGSGGTDLLLVAGSAPRARIDGALLPIEGSPELTGESIQAILSDLLDPGMLARFESGQDIDFSFSWGDLARVRGNAYRQKTDVAVALRLIPSKIPTFEELGLPNVVAKMASLPQGLVLVTGPTGSGKSTTLASIIGRINETRAVHVLTIEDPIEYVHHHKRSAISQREVGVDSPSFERALRSALREDPDVLLVGEMRDLETIQIALTLAETGHLVFATLHTNDAAQALDRIVDVFPGERQEQIRVQLAASLAAVVAQRLVARTSGGMVAAFEVLVGSHAARNLIREGKSNQLRNVMTMSQQDGMRTLEMSLADLVESATISSEDALAISAHPKELTTELSARAEPHTSIGVSARPGLRSDLPYQLIASATPFGSSWLVATAKIAGSNFAPEEPQLVSPFTDVIDLRPAPLALAIEAPLGGLDIAQREGRACDRQARTLLAQQREATGTFTPSPGTLEAEAAEFHDGVIPELLPPYREVAAELSPFHQRWIFEVRSELSFFEMNGGEPLLYPKRSDVGQSERKALVEMQLPGFERILGAALADVTASKLLDVAACLWTARRIVSHAIVRLPDDPEWDDEGMSMAIVR